MTREDIVEMAREAGFFIENNEIYSMSTQSDQELTEWIERFAALVASAEREECKKLCTWKTGNQFVDEAVAVCYRAIDQRGQE